ncbi:MAG: hypothetical protein HY749_05250 [Gammaproteobacteria bacterium]|nr:hypothetical protein [Gammaproteobacteria bacterium]
MQRRSFFKLLAAALAAGTFGWPAPSRAAGEIADDPLAVLDDALWIPDGPDNARHLYVIGAPWCAYCATVYRETRKVTGRVQLRWLETGAEEDDRSLRFVAEAALGRDPSTLAALYAGKKGAPKALDMPPLVIENARRCQRFAAKRVMNWLRAAGGRGPVAYPQLVYRREDRTVLSVGAPRSLEKLLAAIVPRPAAKTVQSRLGPLLDMHYTRRPVAAAPYFAKRDATRVYCLPDPRAIPIVELATGEGYNALSITEVPGGGKWLELKLYPDDYGSGFAPLAAFEKGDASGAT